MEYHILDQLKQTPLSLFDLSSYINLGEEKIVKCDDKRYAIQRYQGEHKDEYTVMEVDKNGVKNGLAQLFDNGIIQLSWRMVAGKRDGSLTVYENGIVNRSIDWNSIGKELTREVLNDESGNRVLIEKNWTTGIITYKGCYNHETLNREGYGVEYDESSGVEKYCGYYRENALFHIKQSFIKKSSLQSRLRVFELSKGKNEKNKKENDENVENEMIMIEFGGDEKEDNNKNVLNRRPIYMGGYRFDKKRNEYLRNGIGYELNELSGICDNIGEWDDNGLKKEGVGCKLYGGWYGEGESDKSIRLSEIDEEERKRREEEEKEKAYWNEERPVCSSLNLSQIRGIEEFVIGNNSMNGLNGNLSEMKLELIDFPRLKRIEIGSNSFQNVRGFILTNLLNLMEIKIGVECFRINNEWVSWGEGIERSDGIFRLTNCPNLSQIELGDNSFCDFKYFDISALNSLQSIDFGKECFMYSAFCLKGEYCFILYLFIEFFHSFILRIFILLYIDILC